MKIFLTNLYDYISEHTPQIRNDPGYEQALQAYTKLEEEVKEKIGGDLLYEYQCAEANISHQWEVAVFAQALRFSARFLLDILR